MKITFLGTGTSQGVPIIGCDCEVCKSEDPRDKRLRSSVWIRTGGKSIVIDTGPDFRQQMLRAGARRLDAILYTHEHRDHIAGMDDIRAFNYIMQKPMETYGEERVYLALRQEFPYVFAEKQYPGIPRMNYHIIDKETFMIDGVRIQPIRAFHLKLPVLGYLIGNFTYITDANHVPEEEKEKIRGTEYLVLNALRKKKHISHFNLEEALRLSEELKPRHTFFTHISHQMGKHDRVNKELPGHASLAYDQLTIEAEENRSGPVKDKSRTA